MRLIYAFVVVTTVSPPGVCVRLEDLETTPISETRSEPGTTNPRTYLPVCLLDQTTVLRIERKRTTRPLMFVSGDSDSIGLLVNGLIGCGGSTVLLCFRRSLDGRQWRRSVTLEWNRWGFVNDVRVHRVRMTAKGEPSPVRGRLRQE